MKKVISIIVLSMIVLISLNSVVLAQPTTTFNHNKVEEEDTEKYNNNLKSLSIDNYEFYPEFNSNTINYYISVNTDITSLSVNAEAEVESATVKISGNDYLNKTENQIKIVVTPKSRVTKTYIINVLKRNNTEALLSDLKIEKGTLSPEFSSTCFYYTTTAERFNLDPLEIVATPSNENSKVEINGNNNLNEGKNTVSIIVRNGEHISIYTVEVDIQKQTLVETVTNETGYKVEQFIKTATEKVKEFLQDETKRIAVYVASGTVLLLIIIVIIRKRIKKKKAKENKENLKRRAK